MQEFQFRGIQKAEWQTLFDFISAKGLRIENLEEAERGPGGGGRAINLDLGDDIDQGVRMSPKYGNIRKSSPLGNDLAPSDFLKPFVRYTLN